MTLYNRASDEMLREAGIDPSWVDSIDDPKIERDGPYAVYRDTKALCPCCSGQTHGWCVINLETCSLGSATHFGDNGQCKAEEETEALNAAWVQGYESRAARLWTGFG